MASLGRINATLTSGSRPAKARIMATADHIEINPAIIKGPKFEE
jgi:hypothetical protein